MHRRGFTTMELLIVIAATAILTVVVSIPLSLIENQQGLTASVSATVEALRRAQTQAMSGWYGDKWGVHLSASDGCSLPANRIWIFRGDFFTSATTTIDSIDLPNSSKVTAISVGGGCDVKFLRFAGSTTSTGTVTVTDPNGNAKVISINSYGRITLP